MTFYKYKLNFWVKVLMFWALVSLAVFLFQERGVFLTRMDPTEINAEQPPMGKYLIGLSILVFKNPVVLSLFLGFGMLVVVFLIAQKILKESSFSFLVIFLLILDRLFRENLITLMLDLPFSFFICLTFLFLLLAEGRAIFFLPAAISLGLATATKVHLVSFGLLAGLSFLIVLMAFTKKEKRYLSFFAFVPFFFLVYFGAYGDFKDFHFWVHHFAPVGAAGYPKGEIFKILFLGKWRTTVNQWSVFWPLSFTASILAGFLGWKRKNYPLLLLIVWIFAPLLVYSFGPLYPHYLLPILPPLYIILIYTLFMRQTDEKRSPSN